jgi:hypothetical protein
MPCIITPKAALAFGRDSDDQGGRDPVDLLYSPHLPRTEVVHRKQTDPPVYIIHMAFVRWSKVHERLQVLWRDLTVTTKL